MRGVRRNLWIWYAILVAVVAGLFAPTMVAQAGAEAEVVRTCPTPK